MLRILLSLLTLILSGESLADWENPANRYLDEHKKHASASCPIANSTSKQFVYLSRDRAELKKHPILESDAFAGAQIMYSWRQLEPKKDHYDFSIIEEDLAYLRQHGKALFIQLQDATFHPKYKAVPRYLQSEAYAGGIAPHLDHQGKPEGWVAKRWNPAVQDRLAKLLHALGKKFDGKIEGINLQETAITIAKDQGAPAFSEAAYFTGLKANMLALKNSFPNSATMLYANFMPGEWLPFEDKGYLKGLYQYGQEIDVGLGAPDLLIKRKGQLNHALALMHEDDYDVPLGIAVQDGNYIGETNNTQIKAKRSSLVPQLHSFATLFLKVDYIFWANQQPYFEEDVLSCFGG